MSNYNKFASESVCAGHPDKVCDQISDAILDEVIKQDPNGRVAVEALAANNHMVLAGEVSTTAQVDYESVARNQIKRLGYTNPDWGFTHKSPVVSYLHQQSPEIAIGVDKDGAGDQGLMFGFACSETPNLMPLPITLAHKLVQCIDQARETKKLPYLRPDGKSQVVVDYKKGKPVGVSNVTLAVPHDKDIELDRVREDLYKKIVLPVLAEHQLDVKSSDLIVNGTGAWHIPGPSSDCGLTGRKIIVDGYGGYAKVGGGAFSGKDPSKVDRSGAYAARFIAKNIVAAGLADKAEVGLAYYIGAKCPVWFNIETFATATVSQKALYDFAEKLLAPSVKEIIETLQLKRPLYLQTAAYGHFGHPNFPWEEIKQV